MSTAVDDDRRHAKDGLTVGRDNPKSEMSKLKPTAARVVSIPMWFAVMHISTQFGGTHANMRGANQQCRAISEDSVAQAFKLNHL